MIKTRRLKNVVIFIQTILSFMLSRKIINIYNDIASKYGNVTFKGLRKNRKLEYKENKLKIDIDFLNNCKQLGVHLKFVNLLSLNCRMFLIKTLYHFIKYSFAVQSISFLLLTSTSSHNKKLLQKLLYIQQKKLSYLHSQLTKLLLILRNMIMS